jgi:hypothetical protein
MRESQLPHLVHDLPYHVEQLQLAGLVESRCQVTGLSLHQLRKVGQHLQVDRLHNGTGYVKGNTQIIADSLNRAKGQGPEIPQRALRILRRKLERCANDSLSATPTQSRPVDK